MKVVVCIPTLLTLCLIPWDAQAQTCSTVDYDGKVGDKSHNSVICCQHCFLYPRGEICIHPLNPRGGTLGSDVILN